MKNKDEYKNQKTIIYNYLFIIKKKLNLLNFINSFN